MISSIDRQLGVLLRQTQWLLDDAAHDIPAGRYHPNKRDELAIVLECVARLVRTTRTIVFDPPGPPRTGSSRLAHQHQRRTLLAGAGPTGTPCPAADS